MLSETGQGGGERQRLMAFVEFGLGLLDTHQRVVEAGDPAFDGETVGPSTA